MKVYALTFHSFYPDSVHEFLDQFSENQGDGIKRLVIQDIYKDRKAAMRTADKVAGDYVNEKRSQNKHYELVRQVFVPNHSLPNPVRDIGLLHYGIIATRIGESEDENDNVSWFISEFELK